MEIANELKPEFRISFDGCGLRALAGQTIADALMNEGILTFSVCPQGTPRGLFCGMGVCTECSVYVDGMGMVTACTTLAVPGMKVWSSGPWEREVPS